MELFRLVGFGLLVSGSVAFSQGVKADPKGLQNEEICISGGPISEYLGISSKDVIGCQLVDINLDHHMQKRALGDNPDAEATSMSFLAFGEDINLWLHPQDSLLASTETPVYFAYENRSVLGGVSLVLQADAMAKVGRLYEDANHYASVVLGWDPYRDAPTVTGNLRSKRDNAALVIRPLPKEVVKEHLRKRRSIDGNNGDSSLNSARHIVMKIKNYIPSSNIGEGESSFSSEDKTTDKEENITIAKRSVKDFFRDMILGITGLGSITHLDQNKPKQDDQSKLPDSQYSIYPKIFVTIDSNYWSQRSLQNKSEDFKTIYLLEYVLAFWNGVDLSYRQFKNPNVRLHIAGIVIAMSPAATPYFNDNLRPEDKFMYAQQALNDDEAYYWRIRKQISYDTYDIAATMTWEKFKDSVWGMSHVGPVCDDSTALKKKNLMSLIRDSGGFDGILIAVHEVAHALGIQHDGKGNACKSNDDVFAMYSSIVPSPNSLRFSPCSLARFNEILRRGGFKCMYEPPQKKFRNLPKPMPGKFLNSDQQCRKLDFHRACHDDAIDPCVSLCCEKTTLSAAGRQKEIRTVQDVGAAPGTPCGNKKDTKPRVCLLNRCVTVDEPHKGNNGSPRISA